MEYNFGEFQQTQTWRSFKDFKINCCGLYPKQGALGTITNKILHYELGVATIQEEIRARS